MKNSVVTTYNENRDNPGDLRRLLVLCTIVLGVILMLYVPFRVPQGEKEMQIVYALAWDPPYVSDKQAPKYVSYKHTPKQAGPPARGPFIPLLIGEFMALTIGTLIIRDRLGKSDIKKLESYPGYQRGF